MTILSFCNVGIQRAAPESTRWPPTLDAASTALDVLKARMSRLEDNGGLGGRTVAQATLQFHALCEGLAANELRGTLNVSDWELMWRQGLAALVAGLAQPATPSHSA